MVFTESMAEFTQNIRDQKARKFWLETARYQKFSPEAPADTSDRISSTPPGAFDDAEETVEWEKKENTSWGGLKKGHCDSGRFKDEQEAVEYAIKCKHKVMLKAPNGQVYWFRHPINGRKTYSEIESSFTYQEGCRTWIFYYD
tara:strand:- start:268 stop:696 length:429 start_codon:yes stop_codon:yes gene_type:complete